MGREFLVKVDNLMAWSIFSWYSSGVKATDKREGGGAHNWGTVKDDLE